MYQRCSATKQSIKTRSTCTAQTKDCCGILPRTQADTQMKRDRSDSCVSGDKLAHFNRASGSTVHLNSKNSLIMTNNRCGYIVPTPASIAIPTPVPRAIPTPNANQQPQPTLTNSCTNSHTTTATPTTALDANQQSHKRLPITNTHLCGTASAAPLSLQPLPRIQCCF